MLIKHLLTKLIRIWYFIQNINCVSDVFQNKIKNHGMQQMTIPCLWIYFYEKSNNIAYLRHI